MGFFDGIKDVFDTFKLANEVNMKYHPTHSYAQKKVMNKSDETVKEWAVRVRGFLTEELANESDPEVYYERREYVSVLWFMLQYVYGNNFGNNSVYKELWKSCVKIVNCEERFANEVMFKIFIMNSIPITNILNRPMDHDTICLLIKEYFRVGYQILNEIADKSTMTHYPVRLFDMRF